MVALRLADLRRELNGLARAGAVFAPDLAEAILSAYGLGVAEAVRDRLQARIAQVHEHERLSGR
jgi:hypothetical protein